MGARESHVGVWSAEGHPLQIEYALPVIEAISALALEAFKRMGHGGIEVGGVLFGNQEGSTIKVLASLPMDCEHALGPKFRLSERDRKSLVELVRAPVTDVRLRGMEPVGWYVSHTRSGLSLNQDDLEIYNQYFPSPRQVVLVIRPQRAVAVRAAFFFREPDGHIRCDTPYQELEVLPLLTAMGSQPLQPEPESPEPEPASPYTVSLVDEPDGETSGARWIVPESVESVRRSNGRRLETEETHVEPAPPESKAAPEPGETAGETAPEVEQPESSAGEGPEPAGETLPVKVPVPEAPIQKPEPPEPAAQAATPEPPEPALVRAGEELSPAEPLAAVTPIEKPEPPEPAAQATTPEPPEPVPVAAIEGTPREQPEHKAAAEDSRKTEAAPEVQTPLPSRAAEATEERAVTGEIPKVPVAGSWLNREYHPELDGKRAKKRRKMLAIAAAVLAAIGLEAALYWFLWSAHAQIALRADDVGGQLRISWNRNSKLVREADGATLEILDGEFKYIVDFEAQDLKTGSVTYARRSSDIGLRLRLRHGNADSAEASTRFRGAPVPEEVASQALTAPPVTIQSPTPADAGKAPPGTTPPSAPAAAPEKGTNPAPSQKTPPQEPLKPVTDRGKLVEAQKVIPPEIEIPAKDIRPSPAVTATNRPPTPQETKAVSVPPKPALAEVSGQHPASGSDQPPQPQTAESSGVPKATESTSAGTIPAQQAASQPKPPVQAPPPAAPPAGSPTQLAAAQPQPLPSSSVENAVRQQPPQVPPTPSAAPSAAGKPAPPAAYQGPVRGRIIWTGQLQKGGVVSLQGKSASSGYVTGELPSVPVRISVSPGELSSNGIVMYTANPRYSGGASEPASAQNGWNKTNFKWDPKRANGVLVLEAPGPQNGWKKLVLRGEDRGYSVVVIDWEVAR